MHLAVIGNGITGVSAALEVRRLQPEWEITLISGESPHFFSRPALMYVFMGHMSFEDTKPYEDWFWKSRRIDLIHDWVRRIDTQGRELHFAGRDRLAYDALLLATGSRPNKFGWPGQDLENVQGFYSLQDLADLESAAQGLRTAVISGGGLIGVELAECLHSRGAHVVMLARESSYWNNILPAGESRMITDVIRSAGIDLRLEEELAEIVGDSRGRARAVKTKAGETIECQLVGLTAGVSPNLTAIEGTDIEHGRGILVDERFETNVEGVFAAGDCAELRTPEGERNTIEQLWYTGKMQGAIAGRIIAGEQAAYDRGIWYNSAKFVDLEWHTYGQVPGELFLPDPPPSRSLYWEHRDRRRCLRIAHEEGVVKGMNAMGLRHRHRVWERWIAEGRDIAYVLEHLREANFDPELFARYERQIVGALREQLP
jgi:NADPH-dependent 2,4-dienoyl-CoA reductase/sulfur reductase-like enzyme